MPNDSLNRQLPNKLFIGDFNLVIEKYTNFGNWDFIKNQVVDVSGEAYVIFDCGELSKCQVLVQFFNVTIQILKTGVGRIIRGRAEYHSAPLQQQKTFSLSVDGFILQITSLLLEPTGATADIILQLPESISSADTCDTITLKTGKTSITPACEIYVERPNEPYGPWIIGDTGLVISGTGYIVDLKQSLKPERKGLLLKTGLASGSTPETSNSGYLAGRYSFSDTYVSKSGFRGLLKLSGQHIFHTIHPFGYQITIDGGQLSLSSSKIDSGALGPGTIILPTTAVCNELPGKEIIANFSQLTIENNLDITGEVTFDQVNIAWGELTHPGNEVLSWMIRGKKGYIFLPAGMIRLFSPEIGNAFLDPQLSYSINSDIAKLKSLGITGITVYKMEHLQIYSPDRPDETSNPLGVQYIIGWLRIGSHGVDGEFHLNANKDEIKKEIGNYKRQGYVGRKPFDAFLFTDLENPLGVYYSHFSQFVMSAVYDFKISGAINIPVPCDIKYLDFKAMSLTSTANLVGGNVILPVGGVNLDYWKLNLVPTGDPEQAGIISVRTGRIVFMAAGISEPVHFKNPFALVWGEMLADGNLGELFFDYNSFGQRFDGIPFSHNRISLSKYVEGATDAYLAVCGTIHINFFGNYFVNIHDARHNAVPPIQPYRGRNISVPKQGEASCNPTNLHLQAEWNKASEGALAIFDFPDTNMDYNELAQDGFIGKGSTYISFLKSDSGLESQIEVHGEATDIRLMSTETHDIDLGLFQRLGGMNGIYGCARIEGPTLKRISMHGYLEKSTVGGMGILAPKAGFTVEINITTTPSSFDFYAAGDLLLSVAGSAVDISAAVHLFFDYVKSSAEGDLNGRINCNTIIAGLEGEGQITWYIDPSIQYLQGKMKMAVISWVGGGGMEGGLFIGHNVDKLQAWVLQAGGEHFGISNSILPNKLTGLFGYGQISSGVNLYVFGGGYELYAGIGAFDMIPPGMQSAITGLALPYILGSCGIHVYGEILGGLVSASAWADLDLRGPVPLYFEGSFGLEGCAFWVMCKSVNVTAGLNSEGFYLY